MAFHNAANYGFLALTAVVGWAEHAALGWVPLAIGGAAEALWLGLGPKVPPLKRRFDATFARAEKRAEARRQQEVLRTVGEEDRRRFLELDRLRQEIHGECAANPTLGMGMLRGELDKVDGLLASFLTLASRAARFEAHMEESDLAELEAELRRHEAVVEKAPDPETRHLAEKNRDVLRRRVEKAADLRRLVRTTRGQLNLFENTFRLLRDQIVTMQSPDELIAQLDELTQTIDTIAQSGRETDNVLRDSV